MAEDTVTPPVGAAEPLSVPPAVASPWHTLGLLLINGVFAVAGTATEGELPSHANAIPYYLHGIVGSWMLFGYCLAGARRRGGIWALAGGRWTSWRSVGADLAIMVPFWLILEGAAYGVAWLLGPNGTKSLNFLVPQSALEVVLWICASATAGVCEEMVRRGYLQRQMYALGRNLGVAIVVQGVIFGLFHAYQGWKHVVSISVMGILFGALAAWRRNLRVNILSHAWTDVWEGWLRFVVWR
jgi:membrane protease YdiL (CAAX protease family)